MDFHSYINPEEYSRNNLLQFNFAMEIVSQLEVSEKSRILDLGCGDGIITSQLARMAKKGCVLGSDVSEKMIEFASITYKSLDNLRFIRMDTSKNFFCNQFDIVTSFNSLHWLKDQRGALQGVANAVVENGKVVLLLSHKKSLYHQSLDLVCEKEKWSSYFRDYDNPRSFFEAEEYTQYIKEAGLSINSLVEKEMIYNFGSIEKFKAFLNASMANIKKIPDSKKDEFLNDFCEIFIKLTKCENLNNIPVGFWCLEVKAVKPKQNKKSVFCSEGYTPVSSLQFHMQQN